jgi:hypothetical protein
MHVQPARITKGRQACHRGSPGTCSVRLRPAPPGVMDQRFAKLKGAGDHLSPEDWDNTFRTQTGQNINVAVNGIAKLLQMMIEEDE